MLKFNTQDRFELPVIDGPTAATLPAPVAAPAPKAKRKPAPARKPKAKRKPAPARKPRATAVQAPAPAAVAAAHDGTVTRWATFGVLFTLVLSAALNGYANAQHSPIALFGWLMGLAVPVLVLTLSKVAGEKFRSGQAGVAYFAAGSGVALLVLSVWHCSEAIALITGSGLLLAVPLAVAIDCGLIACELALITEPRS